VRGDLRAHHTGAEDGNFTNEKGLSGGHLTPPGDEAF
jgi:hypothetical protein